MAKLRFVGWENEEKFQELKGGFVRNVLIGLGLFYLFSQENTSLCVRR